jgi:hypothetical protein
MLAPSAIQDLVFARIFVLYGKFRSIVFVVLPLTVRGGFTCAKIK